MLSIRTDRITTLHAVRWGILVTALWLVFPFLASSELPHTLRSPILQKPTLQKPTLQPPVLQQPTLQPPALLPDTGGSILSVALSVNSARKASLRNAQLTNNIVNALSPWTKFFLVTTDRQAFEVVKNAVPQRVTFLELPFSRSMTIWTQDPFLVLSRSDEESKTILLSPRVFEREGDASIAGIIAQSAAYSFRKSKLDFEGGNIVSDERFIFIGASTILQNAERMGISPVEAIVQFQLELGRKVIAIGPVPQPVDHIDMILTPLGEKRIALADASLGIRIAEEALKLDPEGVEAFERHCEMMFFSHPSVSFLLDKQGVKMTAPKIRGELREVISRSRKIAATLDKIALSLAGYGYEVVRMPFLFGGPDENRVASYPMLSYNNVLLEDTKVYLPRYGWPAFDRAAHAVWKTIGFQTQPIDGLTTSAMYGGSLRCSAKVLARRAK